MKNGGKKFEQQWKDSVPENVFYLRIKDSASSFASDSSATRFTLCSPYDCIIFYNGTLYPMELKHSVKKSLSIQRENTNNSAQIKKHQIDGLTSASKKEGVFAGFVIDFEDEECYWISIENFNKFLVESDKKSINKSDIIKYNGISVEKIKKRTNYKYNITKILNEIHGG